MIIAFLYLVIFVMSLKVRDAYDNIVYLGGWKARKSDHTKKEFMRYIYSIVINIGMIIALTILIYWLFGISNRVGFML